MPNPSVSGATAPLVGVDTTVVPRRADSYNAPGVRHERLRQLLRASYSGGFRKWDNDDEGQWTSYMGGPKAQQGSFNAGFTYEERSHSGDGKVFPPTIVQHESTHADKTETARTASLPRNSFTETVSVHTQGRSHT